MKTIEEAIKDIYTNIDVLSEHNPIIGKIFYQSFGVAANSIEAVYDEQGEWKGETDITKYIEMLNSIFGVSMQSLVEEGLRQAGHDMSGSMSDKDADQATLDFITSDDDLDDYERFVKQNQAKDDLDFLKKEL